MQTDLANLLCEKCVDVSFIARSRKHVISTLAARLGEETGLDPHEICDAVLARERLGSTGVGEGVAIPHARIEGLERSIGGFMRLSTPLDFEAIDDRPCDLVFMLLAPLGGGAEHLRALAQVSRVFRQEAVREKLRAATSVDELRTIFGLDVVLKASA